MPTMRRSTAQIETLLAVAESNYLSILRSGRYAEASLSRNRDQWLQTIRELQIAWWVAVAILRWVLMLGLNEEELKWVPKELEDRIAPHNPGDRPTAEKTGQEV